MADDGINDEELEALFRGSDKLYAVSMFDAYRRENMWRYIVSVVRYLTDEQIHEVYQQSLFEFIACVQKPDFVPEAPERLFKRIARFRAIDKARKKGGGKPLALGDLVETLAADLRYTKMGVEWKFVLQEDWPKFRKALDQAIAELPDKQKTAALGVLEVYDEMRKEGCARPLAAWIRRTTNDDCTTAQAADRWRAAKEKIEDKLTRAGFRKLFEDYL
jgi:DNA-directed RNA polymerase specialized sigma24 family protein